MPDHRADERVDDHEQRELREVLARPSRSRARRRTVRGCARLTAAPRLKRKMASISAGFGGMPSPMTATNAPRQRERTGSSASRTRCARRLAAHARAARRPREVRRVELERIGEREQLVVDARVQLRAFSRAAGQVGPADGTDEQRVAREHEPRLGPRRRSVTTRQMLSGCVPACGAPANACCRARSPARRRAARTGTRRPPSDGGSTSPPSDLRERTTSRSDDRHARATTCVILIPFEPANSA